MYTLLGYPVCIRLPATRCVYASLLPGVSYPAMLPGVSYPAMLPGVLFPVMHHGDVFSWGFPYGLVPFYSLGCLTFIRSVMRREVSFLHVLIRNVWFRRV